MKVDLIPLGLLEQRHVRVKSFPVVLGRTRGAEVHVKDPWISRCHCVIEEVDGTLVVRDLESSNGTFVNGSPISAAPLLPGDQITVGFSEFRVSYKRTTTEAPPPVVYASPRGIHEPAASASRLPSVEKVGAHHTRLDRVPEVVTKPTTEFNLTGSVDRDPDSTWRR